MAFLITISSQLMGYDSMPGRPVYVKRTEGNARTIIHPPQQYFNTSSLRSTTFEVSYTGFPYQAEIAFQYAIDIWSSLISSPVPVHINATWEPLDSETLGYAGATLILKDFPGAPVPDTYYPISLAEKLNGSELNSEDAAEINVSINSTINWYLDIDGNTPDGNYDFVSVSLHEICHGLGFLGSMNVIDGYGSWGISGSSIIYDQFVVDDEIVHLTNPSYYPNPSYELGNALTTDNIYWAGEYGLIGNEYSLIKLYAPLTWDLGSSFLHLDEDTYFPGNPNSLMTPNLQGAEAIHDPGILTLGILNDIGWNVEYPSYHGRMLDSLALVSLYNHTNGSNWNNNTNWLSNSSIDTWHGIEMSENRVTRISLSGNFLYGNLPADIKHLTKVSFINFAGNFISGTLPNEIQFMYNLNDLNLYTNSISGSIPIGLCFAHNLRNIALPGNGLSGTIPPEIGFLSNLLTLMLSYNALSGPIPSELWTLPHLSSLILSGNDLTGDISTILESAIIPSTLYLNGNLFTGDIGPEIGSLTQLRTLSLGNSNITGPIPPEIGNLLQLASLSISNSSISGSIPDEIWNLINLTNLALINNELVGTIPEAIINLQQLELLDLSGNSIEGTIPAALASLEALRLIRLSHNYLSGSIPQELENLVSIGTFDISFNNIIGSVPSLPQCNLYLNNNMINDLPEFSFIHPVQIFWVQNNKLTFEDIEPNIYISYNVNYAPQDSIGICVDTTLGMGSTLVLELFVGGTANQYQWRLNGIDLPGENNEQLVLPNIQYDEAGLYTCDITNSIATELTLHSRPINVEVVFINSAPTWIEGIPDTVIISEDSIFTQAFYAIDVDGDDLNYVVESSDMLNVHVAYLDSVITITPVENWNGSAEIFAHVSDPDTTVSDTLLLIVNPENDAPQEFLLLLPPDETIFTQFTDTIISFSWESAMDVDGDFIEYILSFHSESFDSIIGSIDTTYLGVDVTGFERDTPILWSVVASDAMSSTASLDTFMIQIGSIVSIDGEVNFPRYLILEQNYPNPFNPSTTLKYGLPEEASVSLIIYDIRGNTVKTFSTESKAAGWYEHTWNGIDDSGQPVSTGLYLTRLQTGSYSKVIKMLYLK